MILFYSKIIAFKALKAYSYYFLAQDLAAEKVAEPYNFIDAAIYILLGLSLLLNITLLLFKRKKNSSNESTSNDSQGNNHEGYDEALHRGNDKLKNENNKLRSEIASLQNKMGPSYEENKTQLTMSSPTIEQQYEDEKPKTFDLKITKPNTIYLPSPFEDNRFSIEDVSTEQTSSSLYQITLDASNTTGDLLILENADFTRALNSPDHYLEKACIYENAFSPNANGINIVEPGKVKLENQDWLITQKIKIKFI